MGNKITHRVSPEDEARIRAMAGDRELAPTQKAEIRQEKRQRLTHKMKSEAVRFFSKFIDNDKEEALWKYFITGNSDFLVGVPQEMVKNVLYMHTNPIAWAAFKRAIEYKRGIPAAIVPEGQSASGIRVHVVSMGANPELFSAQAEKMGIKTIEISAAKPDNT